MSLPSLQNDVTIDRDDAINILIASIGMEEIALSHIINAEGEKIQYVLGTLEGKDPGEVTICDVLAINESVNKTLKTVVLTEMMLQFKLEEILNIEEEPATYTVTYYAGYDGVGGPYVDRRIPAGTNYIVKSMEETGITPKGEFQFIDWSTELDKPGTVYSPGDTIVIDRDIVLYARWGSPA